MKARLFAVSLFLLLPNNANADRYEHCKQIEELVYFPLGLSLATLEDAYDTLRKGRFDRKSTEAYEFKTNSIEKDFKIATQLATIYTAFCKD